MKLPSVLFVKHCPPLTHNRKIFLEKYLPERVPIQDIRWRQLKTIKDLESFILNTNVLEKT
jgi:hypothetical protein